MQFFFFLLRLKKVDGTTYVSIKNGAQKIYTCSAAHASDVYNDPYKYAVSTTMPTTSDNTPVSPTVQCPFCSMDGVQGNKLEMKGNQAVYACVMTGMP